MLSEEKRTKNWSIIMSLQNKTLLFYAMMSSCGDPVSAHSNIFTFFPIKVNDVTFKNLISKMQELNSPKKE